MIYGERDLLAQVPGLTIRQLRRWVRLGWLQPQSCESGWAFDELDLARARLLADMRSRMALEEETVELLLNLLDQLYAARRRLRLLLAALRELPEAERARIARRLRQEDVYG